MIVIKRLLFKLLFPDQFEEINELNRSLKSSCNIHKSLQIELEQQKKIISIANDLVKQGNSILAITKTKFDEWVVLYYYPNPNMFALCVKSANRPFNHNVLCLNVKYDNHSNSIHIQDILVDKEDCDRGYGSLAMVELLKMADKLKAKEINGWISDVDWNHIDRLKHFYLKHGFVVYLNEEKKSGSIQKNQS